MEAMTEEELDEARAREAWEAALSRVTGTSANTFEDVDRLWRNALQTAARLAREGWQPTDPDLIEAREIAAKALDGLWTSHEIKNLRDGSADVHPTVQATYAALKRGRELALSKASQPRTTLDAIRVAYAAGLRDADLQKAQP